MLFTVSNKSSAAIPCSLATAKSSFAEGITVARCLLTQRVMSPAAGERLSEPPKRHETVGRQMVIFETVLRCGMYWDVNIESIDMMVLFDVKGKTS